MSDAEQPARLHEQPPTGRIRAPAKQALSSMPGRYPAGLREAGRTLRRGAEQLSATYRAASWSGGSNSAKAKSMEVLGEQDGVSPPGSGRRLVLRIARLQRRALHAIPQDTP